MINEIIEVLGRAVQTENSSPFAEWIVKYKPCLVETSHQFVVFLKPEATALNLGVKTDKVLEIVLKLFDQWGVRVGAARVLGAGYLAKHEIIDAHYGVINRVSKGDFETLSNEAITALERDFNRELRDGAAVIGAHLFLSKYPSVSPFTLKLLSDNVGVKKLANGTYVSKISIDGATFLVLSPFHPYQIEYFTAAGRAIVVFEGISTVSWKALRQEVTGATNPAKAAKGSIRRYFLENKADLQLVAVNQGYNGIHVSAGPLESMVEIQRFFSDYEQGAFIAYDDTCFGRLLVNNGISIDRVRYLAGNPTIDCLGRRAPAFDLTEEVDAVEGLKCLLESSG